MPIERIEIDDDLSIQATAGIEVTVVLTNGDRRWCIFMTPEALIRCGDWIVGMKTRIHYGAEHMIIVAAPLTASIIELAILHIESEGDLLAATRPLPIGGLTDFDGEPPG